VVKIDVEMVKK